MQDNAPPHSARATMAFLENQHVNVMAWPAVSPDLNPIENVWAHIKCELRQRPQAQNSDELFGMLEDIWMRIDVTPFTASMRRRP